LICLSFDTDHLDDARMAEFVTEVPVPGTGTFFCTQRYEALEGSGHALCAHPLLDPGADWGAALDRAAEEFPDARGIRAHSSVSTHMLSVDLHRRGFRWISARDEAGRKDIVPYREAWGIWHAPIYYMDNMDFSFGDFWPGVEHRPFDPQLLTAAVKGEGVYVFDFHPVHLLLNTSSAEDYLSRRDRFLAGDPLDELRFDREGTRDYYDRLLGLMADAGVESASIDEAVPAE
jgi:hypothetical protein